MESQKPHADESRPRDFEKEMCLCVSMSSHFGPSQLTSQLLSEIACGMAASGAAPTRRRDSVGSSGAAWRRRQQKLRALHRHTQLSISMARACAVHHTRAGASSSHDGPPHQQDGHVLQRLVSLCRDLDDLRHEVAILRQQAQGQARAGGDELPEQLASPCTPQPCTPQTRSGGLPAESPLSQWYADDTHARPQRQQPRKQGLPESAAPGGSSRWTACRVPQRDHAEDEAAAQEAAQEAAPEDADAAQEAPEEQEAHGDAEAPAEKGAHAEEDAHSKDYLSMDEQDTFDEDTFEGEPAREAAQEAAQDAPRKPPSSPSSGADLETHPRGYRKRIRDLQDDLRQLKDLPGQAASVARCKIIEQIKERRRVVALQSPQQGGASPPSRAAVQDGAFHSADLPSSGPPPAWVCNYGYWSSHDWSYS